jgi:hypothetical protein
LRRGGEVFYRPGLTVTNARGSKGLKSAGTGTVILLERENPVRGLRKTNKKLRNSAGPFDLIGTS